METKFTEIFGDFGDEENFLKNGHEKNFTQHTVT
jgi:hypothetical protein